MSRSRAIGEPTFSITSVVSAGEAAAVRAFAAAVGLKVGPVIRLALDHVTGLSVATAQDRAKVTPSQSRAGDSAPPSVEQVAGPKVLFACLMPVSLADQVIAEAKARGITTAGLVRYALTTFTGIQVARVRDFPRATGLPEAASTPEEVAREAGAGMAA
jgi:hypothetical protein